MEILPTLKYVRGLRWSSSACIPVHNYVWSPRQNCLLQRQLRVKGLPISWEAKVMWFMILNQFAHAGCSLLTLTLLEFCLNKVDSSQHVGFSHNWLTLLLLDFFKSFHGLLLEVIILFQSNFYLIKLILELQSLRFDTYEFLVLVIAWKSETLILRNKKHLFHIFRRVESETYLAEIYLFASTF